MQMQSQLFHKLSTAGLRTRKKLHPQPRINPVSKRIPYAVPPGLVPFLMKAGEDAGYAYFNGFPEALERYIADSWSRDAKVKAVGALSTVCGLTVLANLLVDVQNKRIAEFSSPPPSSSDLHYMAISGDNTFWSARGVGAILSAVDKLRLAVPGIHGSAEPATGSPEQKPEGGKKPEENSAPQRVQIVGMPPQQPIEVRLIAMPDREAVVTVERDSDQEIARTIHKERDA